MKVLIFFISSSSSVRWQVFWNQWGLKLRESSAHLVGFIMRRTCGVASGVKGAKFSHNARFIAVASTREGILKMADIAVQDVQ
jgi:uncharacterized UPF0160 family protein